MSDHRFRVIRGQSRVLLAERDRWPASLPWSLVEQWREQIELNHSQTLERISERGGLAPEELWCAARGYGLRRIRDIAESEAGEWLLRVAEAHRDVLTS